MKKKNKLDSRFHTIQLSTAGKAFADKLYETSLALVTKGCATLNAQKAKRFAELFELYAGLHLPQSDSVLPVHYFLRSAHSPHERNLLRSFLIQARVQEKLIHASSCIFAGDMTQIFTVIRNSQTCLYAEFAHHPLHTSRFQLIHFLSSLEHEKEGFLYAMALKILDQFFHSSDAQRLECAEQDCSPSLWNILQAQNDERLVLHSYSCTG